MVIFHQTGKSCEIWIRGPAARASGLCWDTSGDFPMKGGHDQQKCQCAWKVRSLRMTEISTKISFYKTRQIRTSQPNRIFVTTPVRSVSDRFVYRNAFLLYIHPKIQSCMYAKWDLLLHAHAAFCTETSRVMLLPVSAVPDWFSLHSGCLRKWIDMSVIIWLICAYLNSMGLQPSFQGNHQMFKSFGGWRILKAWTQKLHLHWWTNPQDFGGLVMDVSGISDWEWVVSLNMPITRKRLGTLSRKHLDKYTSPWKKAQSTGRARSHAASP